MSCVVPEMFLSPRLVVHFEINSSSTSKERLHYSLSNNTVLSTLKLDIGIILNQVFSLLFC